MEGRKVKWLSTENGKPELSRYLHENPKAGDFNPRRTLSGMLVVIPERLSSIRAIVLLCLRSTLCLASKQEPEVERR